MQFCILEILSQPRIEFACSRAAQFSSSSHNIIDHREKLIEIGTTIGAKLSIDSGSGPQIMEDRSVHVYFPDKKYILRPVLQRESAEVQQITAAVYIENMKLERVEIEENAEIAGLIESLPPGKILLCEEVKLKKESMDMFIMLMESLINKRLDLSTAGRLRCLAYWYEIAALLDSSLRAQVYSALENDSKAPSSTFYHIYRMKTYIAGHLTEPLSVGRIAEAIGLSPVYAGRIFHRECGESLTDYITRCRVELLGSLIQKERNASLAELAAKAGFSDIRYAQRMFRKKTGITMTRHRQLNSGITLLHEDPWKENDLDRDIYVANRTDEQGTENKKI